MADSGFKKTGGYQASFIGGHQSNADNAMNEIRLELLEFPEEGSAESGRYQCKNQSIWNTSSKNESGKNEVFPKR
ncbi:MAG: hypothetical protein LBP87_15615 [Planctomycetaceae bacterium]|jgi:hypothetical protein|nr:hypothetical protein [Planctomycetaceae bacterium]